jgi:hypothetical protein
VILSPDRPAGTCEVIGVGPGSQVRAVLFDFGGVLADEGFRKGLHAIADDQDLDADEVTALGMDCVYESGSVLGKGTAADFWTLMRARRDHRPGQRALPGHPLPLRSAPLDAGPRAPPACTPLHHRHPQ